jgi:predicted RNA binding protein YcfA (HicA-like mRNA interferase family)
MKLPRNVSGEQLIAVAVQLGYKRIRQKGSHVRLRHEGPSGHSITIPLHDPMKAGTLHGILSEIARMRSIAYENLVELL